ncbi:MAG: lysophospholipase [Christensenellaceae bacterium]|nr:lysophospholipase [Christensenellaceae bacterium]
MADCIPFTFPSTAGPELDARVWLPEDRPKAIVEFVHGMSEHIDRYDAPARYLTGQGYLVVGHTHLGHGPKAEIKGFFAKENGWQHLIDDVHALRQRTQREHPGLPYFILGHSMGSFITRCYLREHAEGLAGCILSGTGHFSKTTAGMGVIVTNLVCLLGGEKKPSALVDKLGFSASNKPFAPNRTPYDWLSRDDAEVDKYIADPHCGFVFTGSGYRDLFRGLMRLTDLSELQRIPKDLPLLIFSGDHDPVGGMGDGVKKIAEEFRQAGLTDVTLRLYPDGRHEMFNELNRSEVYADLAAWLDRHLND